MNRQFKFRAWHPGWKKFIFFNDLKLNWSVYSPGGFFLDSQPTEEICYHCFNSKDVKIHQWTGLVDKNGKDIYEGDILDDPSYPKDDWEHCLVKYYPEMARFGLEFYSPDGCEGYSGHTQHIDRWIDGENGCFVIGNIIENTNLLP